jgi:hypothetical protein
MNIHLRKNNFYLGQKVELEDFYKEYKEFTLGYSLLDNISEDKLLQYIEGIYDEKINSSIIQTIQDYIEKYFLKYITSFINISSHYKKNEKNLESNLASLNIGISDDSYITGIPIYKSSLINVINFFLKNIELLLNNIIIFDIENKQFLDKEQKEDNQEHQEIIDLILKNLEIELHVLDIINYNKKYVDNIYDQEIKRLITYYDRKKAWEEKYEIYYKEYLEWNMLMNKYSCKIVEIFEDEMRKNNFVNYIITKYPEDLVYNGDYDIHIKGIVQNKIYHLKFPYQRYIELVRVFKDDMRAGLEKPRPMPLKPNNPIKNIIHKLFSVAKKIISNNHKENEVIYLLIKISIPTNLDLKNKLIGFKTKDGVQIRVRRISHNGPESS